MNTQITQSTVFNPNPTEADRCGRPEHDPPVDPFAPFRKAILSVPADRIRRPNVDLHIVADIVRGHLPRIQALHAALARLPDYDLSAIERAGELAKAVENAQADCEGSTRALDPPPAAEAFALRRQWSSVLQALVALHRLEPSWAQAMRTSPDFRELAEDLYRCVHLFRTVQPSLQMTELVSDADIDRADKLQGRLRDYVLARDAMPATRAAAIDVRDRLWTLLVDTWDEVRRGVAYVRGPAGDAEKIAPSLFGARRRSSKNGSTQDDPPDEPVTPGTTPSGPKIPKSLETPKSVMDAIVDPNAPPVPQDDPFAKGL